MRDDLAEGLARLLNDDDTPPPCDEAMVDVLRELGAAYAAPPPKVGDLVTPRPGVNLRGVGQPHLVVEVFDPPVHLDGPHATPWERRPIDLRVIGWLTGDYVASHMERWQVVPWGRK